MQPNLLTSPSPPQLQVFERVARPVVTGALQGFNGTIFAYGQTGSGEKPRCNSSLKAFEGYHQTFFALLLKIECLSPDP